MLEKYFRTLIALAAIIFISSCAATGPVFVGLEAVPANKALVYIIRPSAFTASTRRINIAIDKIEYIKIKNAGYTIAQLDPGWHEFEQSSNYIFGDPKVLREVRTFGMDLKGGEIYFVGFHADSAVGMPWLAGKTSTTTTIAIPMTFQYGFGVVERNRALEELKSCHYQTAEI